MDKELWIESADEFLFLLDRSGLLTKEQFSDLTRKFPGEYAAAKARDTAISMTAFLTNVGALTYWQCGKLRTGKYKGFFLDDYLLLDYWWYDDEYGYYLAKNTLTGKRVELAFRHRSKTKNGVSVEYHVESEFD